MPLADVGVGMPSDVSLPFFAYGLLMAGELAHTSTIGGELRRVEAAVLLDATLRYRDVRGARCGWRGPVCKRARQNRIRSSMSLSRTPIRPPRTVPFGARRQLAEDAQQSLVDVSPLDGDCRSAL